VFQYGSKALGVVLSESEAKRFKDLAKSLSMGRRLLKLLRRVRSDQSNLPFLSYFF
jgi:hypothetical protein